MKKITPAIAESQVHDQLNRFSHVIYTLMEKSGDWGDAGEHQVQSSFARNILDIPTDQNLDYTHHITFNQKIKDTQNTLGLSDASLDTLQQEFDTFAIKLLDKEYDIHSFTELNQALKKIGSKWIIQGGVYGYAKEFILGEGQSKKMGDYDVVYFEKEHLRSPNTIIAMAAVIGEKEIFVRKESITTIYYQKWGGAKDAQAFGTLTSHHGSPYHTVSNRIKKHVLELYKITEETSLRAAEKQFVEDMKETVLFHELGHGIIQNHRLPIDIATCAEATKLFGEHIITALLELLAELAPQLGKIKGPLFNIATLAKTDLERAEKLYWMYTSDTWFFDTPDTYMYLYSDLMALVLTDAITKDDTLDLSRLKRKKLLTMAVQATTDITQEIQTYIQKNAGPTIKKIQAKLKKENKGHDEIDVNAYGYKTHYWAELFDALTKEPAHIAAIMEILEKGQNNVLDLFYTYSAGKKKPFGTSREYVLDKLLKTGLL